MAYINSLTIKNFKSHQKYQINFNNLHNKIVIYGPNGIGKTNLIETISFFSNSKGIRGGGLEKIKPHNDQHGNTEVKINVNINNREYHFSYDVFEEDNNFKKNFYLEDKKISLSKIKEVLSLIWLSPHTDKVMYEGQSIKKKFLDKMISQNNQDFQNNMTQYKKNTSERLAILKTTKDEKWLNVVEQKISENIFFIFKYRRDYAKNLNFISNSKLEDFRPVEILYKEELTKLIDNNDEAKSYFLSELKKSRSLDEKNGRTNFSINIDEVFFKDKKSNLNTDMCSTGEQKSCLLSIILSNCWNLFEQKKEFILLFDEISSHVDQKNLKKFFDEVEKFNTQIWYTGTSKNLFQVIENKAFFIDLTTS
jgi:DNA replication and repair protein RecF